MYHAWHGISVWQVNAKNAMMCMALMLQNHVCFGINT